MAVIEVTPLMLACQNNDANQVKRILGQGAQVDEQDSTNRTALFYCAENTSFDCIEMLIKAKTRVNHQDKDGYSILHLAVINGNDVMVEYLLNNGADVNISDAEMHSAIHWSVVCGHANILDILLKKNADPETADIHGAFPIHYAAQMCGNVDIWDESLRRDQSKSIYILKKLVEQKVKIDVEDFDQRSPLIWAASSGSAEALTELFNAGSNPNKYEKDGLTALHCAASRGHLGCIKVLVETCKCDIEQRDFNKCTPIFYAATLGQEGAVKLLLKYGCKLDVQDIKGRTVYHSTAAKGQLKCLKLLCEKDPTIWMRNRKGDYPIHEAYYNKQIECVYYLLNTITDKNVAKAHNIYDGRTLLHLAASENDLKLCKRLVTDGVEINPLMSTAFGTYMTPYDIAVSKGANECAKYLKSKGGENGELLAEKAANTIKARLKQHSARLANKRAGSNTIAAEKAGDDAKEKKDESPEKNSKKASKQSMSSEKVETSDKSPTKGKKVSLEVVETTPSKKSSIQDKPATKKNSDQPVATTINKKQSTEQVKKESLKSQGSPSQKRNDFRNKSAQTLISSTEKKLVLVSSSSTSINSIDSVSSKEPDKDNGYNNKMVLPKIQNKASLEAQHDSKNSNENNKKPPQATLKTKSKSQNTIAQPVKQDQPKNVSNNLSKKNERTSSGSRPPDARKQSGENKKRVPLVRDPPPDLSKTKKQQSLPRLDVKKSKNDLTKNSKPAKEKKAEIEYEDDFENDGEEPVKLKNRRNNDDIYQSPEKKSLDRSPQVSAGEPSKKSNQLENQPKRKNTEKASAFTLKTGPKDSLTLNNKKSKSNNELVNADENREGQDEARSKNYGNDWIEEDNMVRVIIRSEDFSSPGRNGYRRYTNTFDRQRLILKSLYEIRRNRINNRDIIIEADLNSLLMNVYNFDVKTRCKSLKDLEKALEQFAIKLSDEQKSDQKRSLTAGRRQDSVSRPKESTRVTYNENSANQKSKSKSLQYDRNNVSFLEPLPGNHNEYLRKRSERKNQQLHEAYKPILPNDIYKNYYGDTPKLYKKQSSPRDKKFLLPLITQKPFAI